MDCVDRLLKEGQIVLKGLYSRAQINSIKESCSLAEHQFRLKGGTVNRNGIHIEHPFVYDPAFLSIIEDDRICPMLEEAIGDRLALANCALTNRQILGNKGDVLQVGSTWHTDSRYVQRGKVRLNHGFGYLAVLCIDNFSESNGATRYVPGSHLFKDRPSRVLSDKDYEIRSVEAMSGDVFILDTGLWHSAGDPASKPRWGMFNMYTPWYFKPYFNYTNMFTKDQVLGLSDRLLHLLHFTSEPPLSQMDRLQTLLTAEEVRERKIFSN